MEVGDDGRPGLEGCGIEEEGKIVRGGRAGGREVMEREVCSETKSEKAQLAPTLVFAFPEKGVVPDRNVPSEQESDHPWFVLVIRGKEAACWTERRKIIRMGSSSSRRSFCCLLLLLSVPPLPTPHHHPPGSARKLMSAEMPCRLFCPAGAVDACDPFGRRPELRACRRLHLVTALQPRASQPPRALECDCQVAPVASPPLPPSPPAMHSHDSVVPQCVCASIITSCWS